MSEEVIECKIDKWIGAMSAVMQSLYSMAMVQKELSRKFWFTYSYYHLWSSDLGMNQKNGIADPGGRNKFPL